MPGMFRESQGQMARSGDCRLSGQCARLRTIERSEAQRASPFKKFFCALRADFGANLLHACKWSKTRKARKDAMPHERGLKPVPPSEFFPSPIPKLASAARSPVTRRPVFQEPSRPGQSIGVMALNCCASTRLPECSLAWGEADAAQLCRIRKIHKKRRTSDRFHLAGNSLSRKDAQRTS